MEGNSVLFSLSVDSSAKGHLSEIARWAKIFAIAGIVLSTLVLARGLYTTFAAAQFTESMGEARKIAGAFTAGIAIGYMIMAVIILLPLILLLRFANNVGKALEANDQMLLDTSFQQLKIYFRY